ncbi:MAG: carbamoyl-phosphate synthase domain-containing protein, partial [Verrucomicrobiota bacterium]
MRERKAILALADGTVFEGKSFGYEGECSGEVVFNTGMTGYQEVLTDPSYRGQIVTMTYPEIGNTGINPEDVESHRPWVEGFIVREAWGPPSNWRHVESLDSYLRRYHVCGISGLDTRALTRRLRDNGSQMAVLSAVDPDPASLVRKARALPSIVGRDLVREVTSDHVVHWDTGDWDLEKGYLPAAGFRARFGRIPRLVAIDYGVKQNILRMLVTHGFDVTVVPAATS